MASQTWDNLTIAANGAFIFNVALRDGASYAVTVSSQPGSPSQTCTVSGGSGTVGRGNVGNITVNCVTNTFAIGGGVGGLTGTGLVLSNNGANSLPISANGAFSFSSPEASGAAYAVTVLAQPSSPSQTCIVGNAAGTVGAAPISNVAINCTTNNFTVGGTVSGLLGAGLVLQANGANNLAIGGNGSFTFGASLASGSSYAVTVLTQPSGPSQTCSIANGSAARLETRMSATLRLSARSTASLSGARSADCTGTGLVLRNNGADSLSIASNGAFTFGAPVVSGAAYAVTVLTQPTNPGQTCAISNATGSVGAANVSNVAVNCTTNRFTIGGTVSGPRRHGPRAAQQRRERPCGRRQWRIRFQRADRFGRDVCRDRVDTTQCTSSDLHGR